MIEDRLREMWFDPTVTKGSMCKALGISYDKLCKLQAELGLGDRDAPCRHGGDGPVDGDPTPDEIAARAAEIRAGWPDSRFTEASPGLDYSDLVFRSF